MHSRLRKCMVFVGLILAGGCGHTENPVTVLDIQIEYDGHSSGCIAANVDAVTVTLNNWAPQTVQCNKSSSQDLLQEWTASQLRSGSYAVTVQAMRNNTVVLEATTNVKVNSGYNQITMNLK